MLKCRLKTHAIYFLQVKDLLYYLLFIKINWGQCVCIPPYFSVVWSNSPHFHFAFPHGKLDKVVVRCDVMCNEKDSSFGLPFKVSATRVLVFKCRCDNGHWR